MWTLNLTDSGTWRITGWLRRLLCATDKKLRLFTGPVPIPFEMAFAEGLYAYCAQLKQSV